MEKARKYIISLDQGTTSSRAVIVDNLSKIVEIVQKEFKQIYPQPGWVEHDPLDIYASQYSVLIEAIAKANIDINLVKAIGLTNQEKRQLFGIKKLVSLFIMQ